MRKRFNRVAVAALAAFGMLLTAAPVAADGHVPMVTTTDGWEAEAIFTVGETVDGYAPTGILDGLGAYELDSDTVRVLANSELVNSAGKPYVVDGIELTGARVQYFDIDKDTREVIDAGIAYDTIYDVDGDVATDTSFLVNGYSGFSRFCSAALFEAGEYSLEDTIFFANEEDGGFFNPQGGAVWAVDPATNSIWHLPDLGRGAWENITLVDTGDEDTVGVILADDSSPFDFDDDGVEEAAPMYLYIGEKDPSGDFPARNGLRGGQLYVFVANNGLVAPDQFNGTGTLAGEWVPVDNTREVSLAGTGGLTGYDEFGYPTQGNLFTQAEDLGAFQFSRPEDVATNPEKGSEVVIASTGVDDNFGWADTFGTIYTLKTTFNNLSANLRIIYDGDADPAKTLRSPDNLDWADDGWIYIQEDKAEDVDEFGIPLFGPGASNPTEAGIVRMTKNGEHLQKIVTVDRSVLLDPSSSDTATFPVIDTEVGSAGEWETSGIIDVSYLWGLDGGELLLFTVQAHGIEDQDEDANGDPRASDSLITDDGLVEGGQLVFLWNTDDRPGVAKGRK